MPRSLFILYFADREKPVFTYCPSDIGKTKASTSGTTEVVSWDEPTFKDNSGYVELVHQTHKSGDSFAVGPINLIRYTVRDYSGNEQTCEFHIKIDRMCFIFEKCLYLNSY